VNELVIDLHLHSRFSRAVSQKMTLPNMFLWGRMKGLNLLSVSDFTHPVWIREAKAQLVEVNSGIYKLKNEKELIPQLPQATRKEDLSTYFMLSTEVSSIYSEGGAVRRIHNLILAPNFEVVDKINQEFLKRGFNLGSDGRPILGISSTNLMELLLSIDNKIALIPCHIWTPWFSLYGSKSGYDRIEDCFGKYAKRIFAVETGLSSDPTMNWRINELENRSIVSFSDAHSMQKMGREATVLRTKDQRPIANDQITYDNIMNALVRGREKTFELAYTIEFYPEEGKYHYTGHRNCNIVQTPYETKKNGAICPVCGSGLTVGVMHRVEDLANTTEKNYVEKKDENGVVWMTNKSGKRPKYVNLVPLLEILSEALGAGVATQTVESMFEKLLTELGTEHEILLRSSLKDIESIGGIRVREAIEKVRSRTIHIVPGYDNTYGIVEIWDPLTGSGKGGKEFKIENKKDDKKQMDLEF
jgi:uncharacterized protein (TIGR00375 family)